MVKEKNSQHYIKSEVSMGTKTMKQRKSMSWLSRTGLVLMFTLLISIILLHGSSSTASAQNLLLHNSDRFGTCSVSVYSGTSRTICVANSGIWSPSTKWTGSWGIVGAQYGSIDCDTCHLPRSTNIKEIRTTITASVNSFPGRTVIFTRTTGSPDSFGDDWTGRTASTKICEVCHSINKYHNFNTTGQTGGVNHNNTTDCTTCHPHKNGFYASCTACHGGPPVDNTIGTITGMATPMTGATGSPGNPGGHRKHALTLGMACDTCHANSVMSTVNKKIYMQFQVDKTNYPNWSNAVVTSGSMSGYNNTLLSNGYTWTYPTTMPFSMMSNTATNCNMYCHGSTLSTGTNVYPSWVGGANQVACGSCHGVTKANPPTSSSHLRHAGTGTFVQGTTKQGLGLACTECHGSFYSAPTGTHVDGNVDWALNTNNFAFGSAATYSSAATGNSGTLAPNNTYRNCNNVYCHSDVQNNGGTSGPVSYKTPTWGVADLSCDACHGGAGQGNGQPSTGSHALHVQSNSYSCLVCHNSGGSETTNHANGKIIMSFLSGTAGPSAAYTQGTHTPGTGGYGTCSSTYCHGSSSSSPTWGTSSGDAQCVKCHGVAGINAATYTTDTRVAAPGYISTNGTRTGVDTAGKTGTITSRVSNSASVGAHDVHLRATASYSLPISCDQCHLVPTTPNQVGHNDGNVPANNTWGSLATGTVMGETAVVPAYTAGSGGQCTNVYCHGVTRADGTIATRVTPTWTKSILTQAGGADCGKCHGNPPNTATHNSSNVQPNKCFACHDHVIDNATSPPFFDPTKFSLHINGKIDGGGDCDSCHSYDTVGGVWGKNHKDAPTNEGWGAHAAHIDHLKTRLSTVLSATTNTYGSVAFNKVCGVCHNQVKTTAHQPDLGNAGRTIDFNGAATFQFGPLAPKYNGISSTSSSTTPKTCSNISCHFQTTPVWNAY